jgi:hypothetical protein
MKEYSILHPLLFSFFSKSLYRDVGRNWNGIGFLYLLLVLAMVWIPEMIQFHFSYATTIDKAAPAFVSQIPSITITKGEVSTDVPTPYFIKDPQNDNVLAIIDITGEFTSLEDSEAKALLTKNQLIVKKNERETRMYDLSAVESFAIDKHTVERWLAWSKSWLALLFYPFAVLFAYVYRIVQALFYGAIGLLFAKGLNTTLGYQTSVRLAVISVTPVILLDTARSLLERTIPFWWLICFLIALGYLFFAVKANSETYATRPTWQP